MSKQFKKRRAVSYNRFSRWAGRDEENLVTLDFQSDENARLAFENGAEVVAEFVDKGKSGKNLERDGIQAAILMIERGEADMLIVARLSRLSRSIYWAHEALRRITDAGGVLVCGELGLIDIKKPGGKLIFSVFSAFAEFERDLKTEDWEVAIKTAVGKGVPIVKPPVGYTKVQRETYVVNEKYREAIRLVFELRAAKHPWSDVRAMWLEKTGETKTASKFAAMVKCRTYLGEARYGDHVLYDAHEALIDEPTWLAAQSTDERVGRTRGPRGDGSLLGGGLLVCASCGRKMTNAGTKSKPVYSCQRRHDGTECPQPVQISRTNLDEFIVGEFLEWAGSTVEVEKVTDDADLELARLEEETSKLRARRARIAESLADLDTDETAALELVVGIDSRLASIADRRLELVRETAVESIAVATLAGDWPEMDTKTQHRHLAAVLAAPIVVRPTGPKGAPNRAATVASRVDFRFELR